MTLAPPHIVEAPEQASHVWAPSSPMADAARFSSFDMARMSFGTRSLYPFVLAWFARIPRERRASLRVLDLPAGSGVLSAPLAAAGFDVTPSDLFPEYLAKGNETHANRNVVEAFELETEAKMPHWLRASLFGDAEVAPARPALAASGGDMEGELPFDDSAFDLIACVEGIEHVVDRHKTLRELRRVLKPGGVMLITTPNMLSLRARFAYAFAGQRAFKSYVDEHTSVWGRSEDGARTYHGHAFLINYFQLRYSLHHTDFQIGDLWPSNWSPSSLLLTPLTPLVWLATRRSQTKAKRKFARMQASGEIAADATPPYAEMMRHLLSREMLLNATLMVEAKAV